MTANEKLDQILKFDFMKTYEDSNWFMSWFIGNFADVVAEDKAYGEYYVYSVETKGGDSEDLLYKKRVNAYKAEAITFEEVFENMPIKTKEKMIFHLNLFL